MKKINYSLLFILLAAPILMSNSKGVPSSKDHAQIFMANTIDILKDVSPEYRQRHLEFEKKLKSILTDVHGLKNLWAKRDQKGRGDKISKDEFYRRSEKLTDRLLDESIDHLDSLRNILEKERAKIRDHIAKGIKAEKKK